MATTVLATGGAGFIGSHVVRHCLDMRFEVVILDDLSGGLHGSYSTRSNFC